jgi:hypothetical protein
VPDSQLTDLTLLNAEVCSPHPNALRTAREIHGLAHLQRLCVQVAPSPERWGLSTSENTQRIINLDSLSSLQEVTLVLIDGFASPHIFSGVSRSLERLQMLGAFSWPTCREWQNFFRCLVPDGRLHSLNMAGTFLGYQHVGDYSPDLDEHRDISSSPPLYINCLELVLVEGAFDVEMLMWGRWLGLRRLLLESRRMFDLTALLPNLILYSPMLETLAISNPQSLAKGFIDRSTQCRVEDSDGSVRSARVLGEEFPRALSRAKRLRYLELIGTYYFTLDAWRSMDALVFPTLKVLHLEQPRLAAQTPLKVLPYGLREAPSAPELFVSRRCSPCSATVPLPY